MKIVIAHDYLLQFGGAERVVESWATQLPSSSIHCLAYGADRTFDLFKSRDVQSTIRRPGVAGRIEALLPVLPYIARRTEVPAADFALVSTSGWAHHFTFNSPTIAYVHSPARWLYAAHDYRQRLTPLRRVGLSVSTTHLRRLDKPAMESIDVLVANSRVTQSRIREAYGRDAEIVHPPVASLQSDATSPATQLPASFTLVVSRNRGYKNVPLAVAASMRAGMPCVVVGTGTETFDARAEGVYGLGRVSDGELRWLYQHAQVIIGSAHEDFGLTVLEAALEGTPTAAVPVGGYLETVNEGVSGHLASDESEAALAMAIQAARECDPRDVSAWAQSFSPGEHLRKIRSIGEGLT